MSECNLCINNKPIPNPAPHDKYNTLRDYCKIFERFVGFTDNRPCNCPHYVENKAIVELLDSLVVTPPVEEWHGDNHWSGNW